MALINRVTRLFKADFNAVLDQLEEPELILRQAIRDMEDNVAEFEQDVARRRAEQAGLDERCKELEANIAETSEQLDLCFANGKDELARTFLRRKLEAGRLVRELRRRIDSNEQLLCDQQVTLQDNLATLEGLRQKAELFAERPQRWSVDPGFDLGAAASVAVVSDEEVELAFLREKHLRGGS